MPAAIYIETHGGTGVGGSDDHAGVDIGRTFTETPAVEPRPKSSCAAHPRAATPTPAATRAAPPSGRTRRWRWHVRRSAAASGRPPDPHAILDDDRAGDERGRRHGSGALGTGPGSRRRPRRCCARGSTRSSSTWTPQALLAILQDDDFSHADLFRRARRCHERALADAVDRDPAGRAASASDWMAAAAALFDACVPGHPLRAGHGLPRQGEAQARPARGRALGAWPWWPTPSAACTA